MTHPRAEEWLAERGFADSRAHSSVAIAALLDEYAAHYIRQEARVEAALREAQEFLDVTVRSWLPSEHAVCVSRCVHGAWERERADDLERAVVAIGAALEGEAAPAPCARCAAVEEDNARLWAALRNMFGLVENGLLVRNTTNDAASVKLTSALAKAQAALAPPDGAEPMR